MSAPAYIANAAGYETPPALITSGPRLRPNLRVLEPLRNPCPASSWDGARPQAGILRAKGIRVYANGGGMLRAGGTPKVACCGWYAAGQAKLGRYAGRPYAQQGRVA
eukprot:scaffold75457_cov75-Phaeocystis_antarctica.AAC.6